ncbi:MAG: Mut7-C RNAse domain-containing protein, partial [Candidatus Baldrarchaeia archaeon]
MIKFLCDGMLGRIARWLRLLGYDTSYSSSKA